MRRLVAFRNSIEGITRERNRLVHDPHMINEQNVLIAYRGIPEKDTDVNAKIKNTFRSEVISDESLKYFTDRANQLHDDYFALYSEVFARIGFGPSEKTRPLEPSPK